MAGKQKGNNTILFYTVLLVLFSTGVFSAVWYLFYNNTIYTPFGGKGNYLIIAIYMPVYYYFGKLYGSFDLLVSKRGELFYFNFIALLSADFVTYIIIWLLTRRGLPNPMPLLLYIAVSLLIDLLLGYVDVRHTNKVWRPQNIILIYGRAS